MDHATDLQLKVAPKPERCRKALMWLALVLLNDVIVFLCARIVWYDAGRVCCLVLALAPHCGVARFVRVNYFQVDTVAAFGAGVSVSGHLTADSVGVTVDQRQSAEFTSLGSQSVVGVRSASSATSKLVLGKSSSPDWAFSHDVSGNFHIQKGGNYLWNVAPNGEGHT